MSDYRCYLVKDGHIASVQNLYHCRDDAEASGAAMIILGERPVFDAIEVWDRARKVSRHQRAEKGTIAAACEA
jgi:hypothetical protein